jgi:hypothetical protein
MASSSVNVVKAGFVIGAPYICSIKKGQFTFPTAIARSEGPEQAKINGNP